MPDGLALLTAPPPAAPALPDGPDAAAAGLDSPGAAAAPPPKAPAPLLLEAALPATPLCPPLLGVPTAWLPLCVLPA